MRDGTTPTVVATSDAPASTTTFGAPIDPSTPEVPLTQLVSDPAAFAGQRIRSRGTVTAVCQRMGCWMELGNAQGHRVRVPMAGHRFFLPRDISGRQVAVEGTVALRELGPEEREHLASEGAEATAVALQISATGVVLSPESIGADG